MGEQEREGMTGRITFGPFKNMTASVKAVEGPSLRVVVNVFGRATEVVINASDFEAVVSIAESTPPEVSPTSPYRPGDTVLVHNGPSGLHGREVRVERVDEATRTIKVSPSSETGEETLSFDVVTLVAPLRRDLLPDYLVAIRKIHPHLGYQEPLQAWCLEQLLEHDWDPEDPVFSEDGELACKYVELEDETWKACAAALDRRLNEFTEQYVPLSISDRVELWRKDWSRWVDSRRINAERVANDNRARFVEARRIGMANGDLDESMRRIRAVNVLRQRFEKRTWSF